MVSDHPALDHFIIHRDFHVSRVRIVLNDRVSQAEDDLRLLFPHEAVFRSAMGCAHTCVYTDSAPCSLVAERIKDHLHDGEPARSPRPPIPSTLGPRGVGPHVHRPHVPVRWVP
jgi:hypothetical protein